MKIKDLVLREVVSIPLEATYEKAARLLLDNGISGAPVVDQTGRVVGMLSEKDLFRHIYIKEDSFFMHPEEYLDFEMREYDIDDCRGDQVSGIMAKKVISVSLDTPILKAGGIMLANGVHRLPVIEDGKLVGVVSRSDIFGRIINSFLSAG